MPRSNRLAGHGLWHEGAAFDDDGHLIWKGRIDTAGPGRAKCECGELSDVLQSGGARRRWHVAHKAQVAADV